MIAADLLIPILLLIVAFLYSSVGHGGASGYIAVLTLFNVAMPVYKPVVLILNIIIASIAFIQYYRAGYFKWSLCYPFIITSIPFAFFGSWLASSSRIYNLLLGLALIFPIIRLIGAGPKEKQELSKVSIPWALLIGAFIGFISGFLNIGGGIFLSPVLILLSWSNAKQAAAVSSLFIVCNSLAGLAASGKNGFNFTTTTTIWLCAAVIGGLMGSYWGSHKFKQLTVRYLLSVVLCIAAFKLIFF